MDKINSIINIVSNIKDMQCYAENNNELYKISKKVSYIIMKDFYRGILDKEDKNYLVALENKIYYEMLDKLEEGDND